MRLVLINENQEKVPKKPLSGHTTPKVLLGFHNGTPSPENHAFHGYICPVKVKEKTRWIKIERLGKVSFNPEGLNLKVDKITFKTPEYWWQDLPYSTETRAVSFEIPRLKVLGVVKITLKNP